MVCNRCKQNCLLRKKCFLIRITLLSKYYDFLFLSISPAQCCWYFHCMAGSTIQVYFVFTFSLKYFCYMSLFISLYHNFFLSFSSHWPSVFDLLFLYTSSCSDTQRNWRLLYCCWLFLGVTAPCKCHMYAFTCDSTVATHHYLPEDKIKINVLFF